MHIRLVISALALALALPTHAAPVALVRDYTYRASENDSKVSARKAALQQLQALAIEEVGVQVQASLDSTERLDGETFSRTVQNNIQSFAQALTRTRILEEQWDGEHFFLKAEIEVDPDGLGKQLRGCRRTPAPTPAPPRRPNIKPWARNSPARSAPLNCWRCPFPSPSTTTAIAGSTIWRPR